MTCGHCPLQEKSDQIQEKSNKIDELVKREAEFSTKLEFIKATEHDQSLRLVQLGAEREQFQRELQHAEAQTAALREQLEAQQATLERKEAELRDAELATVKAQGQSQKLAAELQVLHQCTFLPRHACLPAAAPCRAPTSASLRTKSVQVGAITH